MHWQEVLLIVLYINDDFHTWVLENGMEYTYSQKRMQRYIFQPSMNFIDQQIQWIIQKKNDQLEADD